MALAVGGIPLFHDFFPYFVILSCIMSVGYMIGFSSPFVPDYVDKSSIGLLNGIMEIIVCLASTTSKSILLVLNNLIDNKKYIYFGITTFVLLIALFLCFALKDVIVEKN